MFSLKAILMLILGWLFGLLNPSIVDAIKRRYRNREIRKAIISELDEARFFLASTAYLLSCDHGVYDRKLLEWIIPIYDNYKGPNPASEFAQQIREQLSMSDEKIASFSQTMKVASDKGSNVKKYRVLYLESRLTDLGAFEEMQQAILFDIRTKFDRFNNEVEEARFYFNMTYQPGISAENHTKAVAGLKESYHHLITTARLTIDRINQIAPLAISNSQKINVPVHSDAPKGGA